MAAIKSINDEPACAKSEFVLQLRKAFVIIIRSVNCHSAFRNCILQCISQTEI
jgi:hypothetical protein